MYLNNLVHKVVLLGQKHVILFIFQYYCNLSHKQLNTLLLKIYPLLSSLTKSIS